MEEDKLREIAKQEMTNAIMNNLDSSLIFTYIKNLEDKNKELENYYKNEKVLWDRKDYISKSKIQEKIEEIKERKDIDGACETVLAGFQREAKLDILQELLEDFEETGNHIPRIN